MRKMWIGSLVLVLAACGGGAEEAAPPDETVTVEEPAPAMMAATFAEELNVNPDELEETESGLRYQDLEAGGGTEAAGGNTVVVHYTGWLTDGTKFDSSHDRAEPFSFVLGQGRVIQGWELGLLGMKEGGKRKLVIPPDLGYGPAGAGGVIPPNATLVFDVELLEVR